jgi:hypothetical protein
LWNDSAAFFFKTGPVDFSWYEFELVAQFMVPNLGYSAATEVNELPLVFAEITAFSDKYSEFEKLNCEVIGVSTDSVVSSSSNHSMLISCGP